MKLPVQPTRPAGENVVPLINVVFLLLIFFMLTSSFLVQQPFEVTPPRSGTAAEAPREAPRLALAPDGRLALDGEVLGRAAALTALQGQARVVLLADAAAPSGAVLELLAELRAAGVEDVLLRADPRR